MATSTSLPSTTSIQGAQEAPKVTLFVEPGVIELYDQLRIRNEADSALLDQLGNMYVSGLVLHIEPLVKQHLSVNCLYAKSMTPARVTL